MKTSTLITSVLLAISIAGGAWYYLSDSSETQVINSTASNPASASTPITWGMKLVNENVSDEDLDSLARLGIAVIEGEWGMDEATPAGALQLLDRVAERKMKLIVNFSDEAGWGYGSEEKTPLDQKPVWQRERVEGYIRLIKHHPAIFGYDISNEAGENLPNGIRYRITETSLKAAVVSVRNMDPTRPIIVRMHYWDKIDGDFTTANPFTSGIADIVILNLYSNYSEDQKTPLIKNMIRDFGKVLVGKIRAVDPKVKIWISLAAFRELPLFIKPTAENLTRDLTEALKINGISGISFFGWGPERYPDEPPGWYLPRDGTDLVQVFSSFTTIKGQ